MKKVDANLEIHVDVECPYCQEWFDILAESSLDDREEILEAVLDDDSLGCEKFDKIVECPECHQKFMVEAVIW